MSLKFLTHFSLNSIPAAFILCYLDSLSTAVLLTMNDPKALVPWELERAHVLLNTLRLQYSDTKCHLWYFLHLVY